MMTARQEPPPDPRVVYGATCFWWGRIQDVAVKAFPGSAIQGGLPCCPVCGGMLMEVESMKEWWENVDHYQKIASDPDYRAFIEWARNRHYTRADAARAAFESSRAPTEVPC